MTAKEIRQAIQRLLGVTDDGIFGSDTRKAYDQLASAGNNEQWPPKSNPQNSSGNGVSGAIQGKASSFADPADVKAFNHCKAKGFSDNYCFGFGDNGIGYTGIDTTNIHIPYVAVQPDYMIQKFGSAQAASGKKVLVTINGQTKECIVGDRMPWIKNTENGAVIDLAPGAQKLFNLTPPFLVNASWSWA